MSVNRATQFVPQDYQSTLAPLPLDEMMKLGMIQQQREDQVNKTLDELTGLAAAIRPAPGHEQYAQQVAGKFNDKIKGIVDSDEPLTSPQTMRKIRQTKAELINDPDFKNITSSKEIYDKQWSNILNDPKNKGAIYNMPGILGNDDKFMQNRTPYSTLDYTPPSSYTDDINNYFKSLPIQETGYSGKGRVETDAQGNRIFVQEEGMKKIRKTSESLDALASQLTTPGDPNYNYLKAKWERDNGPGTYNSQNIKPWLETLGKPWDVDSIIPNNRSQFIGEGASSSSDKAKDNPALPQFIFNQNGQGIPAKEKTSGLNTSNNEIQIPYLGRSSAKVQQTIGVDGRYTLGTRRFYEIGDDSNDQAGDYGGATQGNKTLYNAKVVDNIVGYKITGAPEGSDPSKRVGNIVTTGFNYGSVGPSTLNTPVKQDVNGNYFTISRDSKGNPQRIDVEPVALRVLKGSYKVDDKDDSENIILEEMDRKESLKWFGGANYSNEKPYTIDSRTGTLDKKIDDSQLTKLVLPYTEKDATGNFVHKEAANVLIEFGNIQNKLQRPGYQLTAKDRAIIESTNRLIENSEYIMDVAPTVINPKNEYTPIGVLGSEQSK